MWRWLCFWQLLVLAILQVCSSFQPLVNPKLSTHHACDMTRLRPIRHTCSKAKSSVTFNHMPKDGNQQKPGHHFQLKKGHMEFGAYDQVEVRIGKENQEHVERYISESPERILLATWDHDLIEHQGSGLFRLTTQPVSFVSLQLQPSFDIQMTMQDGFLAIASQAFYLNGLERLLGKTFSSSLKIEVEGRLRPIAEPSGVKLVGEVLFFTSGKLPTFLSLTPKSVLERAAVVVNNRIMNYAKGKFSQNLAADVREWVALTNRR